MRTHDLRELTPSELPAKLDQLTQEYYALREAVRSGKEKNHAKLRYARRAVARATTVLRQKAAH